MIDLLPNATVFIQWFLFLAAYFILSRFVFSPTLKIIKERHDKTELEKENTAKILQKAETLFAEVEAKLEEARRRGSQLKEAHLSAAYSEQATLQSLVRSQNQKMLEDLHQKIKKEGDAARLQLQQDVQVMGQKIAEIVLERAI